MIKLLGIAALSMLLLTGCQTNEDLETSVNNRWAAIISNDLEGAYSYFSPGYKEIENLQSFQVRMATAMINMKWTAAKYKTSNCESESVCNVSVEVDYTYTFPRRSFGKTEAKTTVYENWIKIDGAWRHVPKSEDIK
ncbi:hypothetical protein OS175_02020 [Marinicella sp. S1101]|uniref:hypothetical protein n=1 Tax=Marinicella marina TaxID=2996016 RepID=UPI002260B5D7|nr:hypothetical protein [Marinicella marina]MCX7552641.1 hypothetical protein [Marinicella marina]MDJ1139517.1 hypothetical protein [Marinicella marina]